MGEYIYNSTYLRDISNKLRCWADCEESMFIQEFLCEHKISYERAFDFKQKSEEFAKAYDYAKMKIAKKLHERAASNKFNTSVYNRLIRMYDLDLKKAEDNDKELDYKLKAKYGQLEANQNPLTVNVINYKDAVKTAKANIESKHKARWKDDRTNSDS